MAGLVVLLLLAGTLTGFTTRAQIDFDYFKSRPGWTMHKNAVTLDCTGFDVYKNAPPNIRILHPKFPNGTKRLNVENCAELGVAFVYEETDMLKSLIDLYITNISTLNLIEWQQQDVPWIPKELKFSNIKNMTLPSRKLCNKDQQSNPFFMQFENVVITDLRKEALMCNPGNQGSIKWVNVTVEKWESEAVKMMANGTSQSKNQHATMNITSCNLGDVPEKGIVFNGTEMEIVKTQVSRLRNRSLLIQQADKFAFTANDVQQVDSNGLSVRSRTITLSGNYIGFLNSTGFQTLSNAMDMENNHFRVMEAGALDSIEIVEVIPNATCFIGFQHNIIEKLTPSSLSFLERKITKSVGSGFLNNAINCSCPNKGFFEGTFEKLNSSDDCYLTPFMNGGSYCFNNRNCTLDTVVNSYENMCNEAASIDSCFAQIPVPPPTSSAYIWVPIAVVASLLITSAAGFVIYKKRTECRILWTRLLSSEDDTSPISP